MSELLSWHCTDATRPGVLDELGLAVATVVFLYAYPTLLAQLEVGVFKNSRVCLVATFDNYVKSRDALFCSSEICHFH